MSSHDKTESPPASPSTRNTFVHKFKKLEEWFYLIVNDVKDELQEYLRKNKDFCLIYFSEHLFRFKSQKKQTSNTVSLTSSGTISNPLSNSTELTEFINIHLDLWKLVDGFKKCLRLKKLDEKETDVKTDSNSNKLSDKKVSEEVAEMIGTAWIFKHINIYQYFEEKLKETAGIDSIDEIPALFQLSEDLSSSIIKESIRKYGAVNTHLFCILTSVSFIHPSVLLFLQVKAKEHKITEELHQGLTNSSSSISNTSATIPKDFMNSNSLAIPSSISKISSNPVLSTWKSSSDEEIPKEIEIPKKSIPTLTQPVSGSYSNSYSYLSPKKSSDPSAPNISPIPSPDFQSGLYLPIKSHSDRASKTSMTIRTPQTPMRSSSDASPSPITAFPETSPPFLHFQSPSSDHGGGPIGGSPALHRDPRSIQISKRSDKLGKSDASKIRANNSFIVPRSENDYTRILKSASREGYLEKRSNKDISVWKSFYVVLTDFKLFYFKDKTTAHSILNNINNVVEFDIDLGSQRNKNSKKNEEESESEREDEVIGKIEMDENISKKKKRTKYTYPNFGCIPLYLVNSIRQEDSNAISGNSGKSIVLDCYRVKFHFRTVQSSPDRDSHDIATSGEWLFSLQCSIVLNVSQVLNPQQKEKIGKILRIDKWWKKYPIIDKLLLRISANKKDSGIHTEEHSSITPISENGKNTEYSLKITTVVASTIGQRDSMEDSHSAFYNIPIASDNPKMLNYFGVFDGHGGSEASNYCSENLLKNILKFYTQKYDKQKDSEISEEKDFYRRFQESITDGYHFTDNEYIKYSTQKNICSGTTAITAFVLFDRLSTENTTQDTSWRNRNSAISTSSIPLKNQQKFLPLDVIVGNVGDSRIILSATTLESEGEHKATQSRRIVIPLSTDHKPNLPEERSRIESRGGFITTQKELNLSKLYRYSPEMVLEYEIPNRLATFIGFIELHRVMGELSVSRAIGDREYKGEMKNSYWNSFDYKNNFNAPFHFTDDIVISTPEVNSLPLIIPLPNCNADSTSSSILVPEFLCIACDGLWDVFSNEEAVEVITCALATTNNNKQQAVAELVQEALNLGSMDNITVLTIFFEVIPNT